MRRERMTRVMELRPDRSLINSSFEKYRFSSDIVPVNLEIDLRKYVCRVEPNHDQQSWLEARLFAFHNHLFQNVHDLSCWFIDEDSVVWRFDKSGSLDRVYRLRDTDARGPPVVTYNPSIGFASRDLVLVSDGGDDLRVLVGNTERNVRVFSLGPVESGVVMDVQCIRNGSVMVVTMCAVATDSDENKYTRLTLLSYSLRYASGQIEDISYADKRTLKVRGTVDYIHMEENGDYLHSICQDNISFETEDPNRWLDGEDRTSDASVDSPMRIPRYYWSQDEDSLTVWIKVPNLRGERKLPEISIEPTELSVVIDDVVLIRGECQHRLGDNLATWKWEEDTLRIDLSKCETGLMWNELIRGDTGGECLPDETLAAEIHERLAHLCTDRQGNSTGEDRPCVGFNAEQLEECDLEGRDNFLQRVDLARRRTTHLARLGSNNRVLFTRGRKCGRAVCLRHDHDACVWVMDDASDDVEWNVRHVHTFPGFGYVEASKTDEKFCVAPIDGSYIAIVEHARHVFLYDRPDVGAMTAKQRIVDMNSETSPVMGVVATNEYLIILSKDKLYRLQVRT